MQPRNDMKYLIQYTGLHSLFQQFNASYMPALWISRAQRTLRSPAYIPHDHLITLAEIQTVRIAVLFVQPFRNDISVTDVD